MNSTSLGAASAATLAAAATSLETGASTRGFQGSMDPGLNDMVTAFIVVSLLLLVSIIGFVIMESSNKMRPDGGASLAGPQPKAGMVQDFQGPARRTPDPLPVASKMRAPIQAPPPAPSASQSNQSLHQTSDFYLCGPELVVPDGAECNLEIPSIQYQASTDGKIVVPINDTVGSTILRGVIYKYPTYDGTRILLQSRNGDVTHARCAGSARDCLSLRGKGKQRWGSIRLREDDTVEIEAGSSQRVRFDSPVDGRIRVMDNFGVLMAVSETNSKGRAIRVGPLVDVGFVMLCHLAQDLLQNEAAERYPVLTAHAGQIDSEGRTLISITKLSGDEACAPLQVEKSTSISELKAVIARELGSKKFQLIGRNGCALDRNWFASLTSSSGY